MFNCYLCARAGRVSGPRQSSHSVICQDCAQRIAAHGAHWCNRCRRVVTEWDASRMRCRPCGRAVTNTWQRAKYAADPAWADAKREQARAAWPARRDGRKLKAWRGR